jgi:ATP-dependent exoDNAse (exonuclease V) beta subunit
LRSTLHRPNYSLTGTSNKYTQNKKVTKIFRQKEPINLTGNESLYLQKTLLKNPSNNISIPRTTEPYEETVFKEREFRAAVGTLLHEFFEHHTTEKSALPLKLRIEKTKGYWRRSLQKETIDTTMIDKTIRLMKELTIQTLTGKNAWIFDSSFKDSSNELEISTREESFSSKNLLWVERDYIVDRSFIDKNEERWIIDYKTSIKPDDQSEESFIANLRTSHSPQLQKYASLFSDLEDRPIKKAIFAISLNKLIVIE